MNQDPKRKNPQQLPVLDMGTIRGLLKAAEIEVEAIQQRVAQFKARRDQLLSDKTRSPNYNNEAVATALRVAYGDIGPHREKLIALDREAEAKLKEVADRRLILSGARFSDDDATDAQMAMRAMLELERTPADVIEKTAKMAAATEKFALFYQCWLAARRHPVGVCDVDIEELPMKDQSEAVTTLKRIRPLIPLADLSINEIAAQPKLGAERLALARQAMSYDSMPGPAR
jgi:hypothetical protein